MGRNTLEHISHLESRANPESREAASAEQMKNKNEIIRIQKELQNLVQTLGECRVGCQLLDEAIVLHKIRPEPTEAIRLVKERIDDIERQIKVMNKELVEYFKRDEELTELARGLSSEEQSELSTLQSTVAKQRELGMWG